MIEANSINKNYGKNQILTNVNFKIKSGELVAIVGRNGSGKSTLIKIIAGILKPSSGTLSLFDNLAKTDTSIFRKYCGYVPQDNALIEELSVLDNLKLWGVGKGHLDDKLLNMFDLEDILHETVSKLSGGMKRRVSIACAISHWPPILLLDEPTTALDIFYKDEIHIIIERYRKMNGIVVYTTHDEKEILKSDRCFLIQKGLLRELKNKDKGMDAIRSFMT